MRHLIQLCGVGCLLVISLLLNGCLGGHSGHHRTDHHAHPGFKAKQHVSMPGASARPHKK